MNVLHLRGLFSFSHSSFLSDFSLVFSLARSYHFSPGLVPPHPFILDTRSARRCNEFSGSLPVEEKKRSILRQGIPYRAGSSQRRGLRRKEISQMRINQLRRYLWPIGSPRQEGITELSIDISFRDTIMAGEMTRSPARDNATTQSSIRRSCLLPPSLLPLPPAVYNDFYDDCNKFLLNETNINVP
jgi:hypothetical protein